jgi:hypothetical protein
MQSSGASAVLGVRAIDREGSDAQSSPVEDGDGAVIEISFDRGQVGCQQHCVLLRGEWLDGSQQHE